jgi:hypothetical protein
MNPSPLSDQPPDQTAESDELSSETSLLKEALSLWGELCELSHDHFRLAALETQRAGVALATMVVLGFTLAGLLNVVWFGLMAAAVAGLIENGIGTSNAILLAMALSLLMVLFLIGAIRRKSHYLQYPALLRSLQPTPTVHRDLEKP